MLLLAVLIRVGAAQTAPATPADRAATRNTNIRAYVELLRSDVRAQKVAYLTELMQLTDAEDAQFWPIYREYDLELNRLNDERLRLIERYAENYSQMTDDAADQIIRDAFALEARRTALKEKYYDRVRSALSGKTAARFLQIENQLLMVIDLQIAASLPIVK